MGTALLQIVDVRAALAFVADLGECGDSGQLTALIGTLAALVGADSALVTGCRSWAPVLSVEAGDAGVYTPDLMGAAGRNWQEHPVMSIDVTAGAGEGARRVSDFVAAREWHRREIFNDFYRPLGMRHELSAQLAWDPAGSSCCIALHRSGRDFGDREVALLGLLAPHLRAARDRIGASVAGDSGTTTTERPAASTGHHGQGDGSRATVGPLALTEPSSAALAARLPITPREAEVLARLLAGRTNDGIAADLEISRNTVARHIEHVYAKLGVHTRVAAARTALDALRG